MIRLPAALALILMPLPLFAQLAPNAPVDGPRPVYENQFEALEKAIAPYVEQARASWPAARDRYLAGLPAGETLFVTTRLKDNAGRIEQVFIRVREVADTRIEGLIANQLNLVRGFRQGQGHTFSEADLIDWVITRPDGSEEGNVVGKFLESRNSQATAAESESLPVPATLEYAVAMAQRRGRLLADAINSARDASRAQLRQARDQGAELCDFDYRRVIVKDGGQELIYLIGTTKRHTDLISGRHFLLSPRGAVRSTNVCLNMGTLVGPNGGRVVAASMSHLLSPTPNECHVYLSLIQPVGLMVLTRAGTWSITNGTIELISIRDEGP